MSERGRGDWWCAACQDAGCTECDELPWLSRLYALAANEDIEDALGLLYQEVDELLRAGRFSVCDQLLERVNLDRLPRSIYIGLLTITLPARHLLRKRGPLFTRIEARIRGEVPERLGPLLSGLK